MVVKDGAVVKVLPKGQITLPKKIREELGIEEGDVLILEKKGGGIELKKAKTIKDFYGFLRGRRGVNRRDIDKAVEEAIREREKGSG